MWARRLWNNYHRLKSFFYFRQNKCNHFLFYFDDELEVSAHSLMPRIPTIYPIPRNHLFIVIQSHGHTRTLHRLTRWIIDRILVCLFGFTVLFDNNDTLHEKELDSDPNVSGYQQKSPRNCITKAETETCVSCCPSVFHRCYIFIFVSFIHSWRIWLDREWRCLQMSS